MSGSNTVMNSTSPFVVFICIISESHGLSVKVGGLSEVGAALDALEDQLSHSQWLSGDQFSIADIALCAYTHLAEEGGFDLSSRLSVTRWVSECSTVLGLDD